MDKLKARVCLRGNIQIKEVFNSWSPTVSTRLLTCFIADSTLNKVTIHQLGFLQAFIQSEVKKRMSVLPGKESEQFYPKLTKPFAQPLRLKKCIFGADFSGKSWYETLTSS